MDINRQWLSSLPIPTEEETFPFVNVTSNAKLDAASRTLVKKYVMRGVVAAKSKTSEEDAELPRTLAIKADSRKDDEDRETSHVPQAIDYVEHIGAGRGDPFVSYPIPMNTTSKQLIDILYDTSIRKLDPIRESYSQLAFKDASAFYQMLANTARVLTLHQSSSQNSPILNDTIYHIKAVEVINKRIQDAEDELSDGTITAVLQMAVYNYIVQDHVARSTHMKGLKQIVDLRGGLDALKSTNKRLRLVISWHDVAGSITQDLHPLFPYPDDISPQVPLFHIDRSPSMQYLRYVFPRSYHTYNALIEVLDDLQNWNSLICNDTAWSTRADGLVIVFFSLGRMINHLLRLQLPIVDARTISMLDVARETLRLGSFLYLAALRRVMGVHPVVVEVQLRKLMVLLERNDLDWSMFMHLRVWALVFAVMEVEDQESRAWLLRDLVRVMYTLGIRSVTGLRRAMIDMLWYTPIHDKGFVQLLPELQSESIRSGAPLS